MEEKSAFYFNQGFNCAQSVFTPFAVLEGMEEKQALKISGAFGAGLQEGSVCGAVIGALMVIGLKFGMDTPENSVAKENTNRILTSFKEGFRAQFGSLDCSELLGVDMSNSQLKDKAREAGLFNTKCPVFIKKAAYLLTGLV